MYQRKSVDRCPPRSEQTSTHRAATPISVCHRCLKNNHSPQMCQFKQAECNRCHKKGHIARAWRSKQTLTKTEPGKRTIQAHYVGDQRNNPKLMNMNNPHQQMTAHNLFTIAVSGQDPLLVEMAHLSKWNWT